MKERKKLLSYIRTKQLLSKRIGGLKDEYLQACDGDAIYISDHAIVRYLERIKREELRGNSDSIKVRNYLYDKKISGKELRNEILSEAEQRHIVSNEIYIYENKEVVYVIKNLTLITVYKKEKK